MKSVGGVTARTVYCSAMAVTLGETDILNLNNPLLVSFYSILCT